MRALSVVFAAGAISAAAGCDRLLAYAVGATDIDVEDLVVDRSVSDGTSDERPSGDTASDLVEPSDGPVGPGNWVEIPAGTFTMGSPPTEPCRWSNEDPHTVTLTRSFEIQTTEVTQGQYATVIGSNPSYYGPEGLGPSCGTDCPVERVSWHEAAAYCNALSALQKLPPCYVCSPAICEDAAEYSGQRIYDCPGYRLPTEAEWEYAYRAGTLTAYYDGPNDAERCTGCAAEPNADRIGWYCANAENTTHPVGQKDPNTWGLDDMAGNVWEWCHDWYQGGLSGGSATDPVGPSSGVNRVMRGGAWSSSAGTLRAAARLGAYEPQARAHNVGFRCVRGLP